MSMFEKALLVIYRLKEKGLEIFLVDGGESWELPRVDELSVAGKDMTRFIELDPGTPDAQGHSQKAVAFEGDWKDIPSLKHLLIEDVNQIKDHLKEYAPEMEKGTFFALSEALNKVTPGCNDFIRELKEIIRDRNSVKYL